MNATETILARGARHLAHDPRVIAAALTAHKARTGLDDTALAAWLGISTERLHGLALCLRPDPCDPFYAAELDALARYIGCDANRLHAVLTNGHAVA